MRYSDDPLLRDTKVIVAAVVGLFVVGGAFLVSALEFPRVALGVLVVVFFALLLVLLASR
jgi:hypothetical protein